MNSSLYSHITSTLAIEKDSEDHVYLYAESVLYLTGAASAFEYQRYVKKYCTGKPSAKVFRLGLQASRYTNLSVKLYALRLSIENVTTRASALKIAKQLNILDSDAVALWLLYSRNEWFKDEIAKVAKTISADNENLSDVGIRKTFNRVFPSVHKYIKHIVYKKLRFLVKSTNTDFQDFHQDISAKVSQAFYSLVPVTNTDLYITNYLKRAAHNHAINIIKSETTQKRGRLINVGVDRRSVQQFSLLCVSENQMTPVVDADGNQLTPDAADENNSSDKFELRFSIREILDSVKKQAKKYRFLTLMMGEEDPEFTGWLRGNKVCKPTEDNIDVQSRETPAIYTGYVANFLRVSQEKVQRFLYSLRSRLALA